MFITSKSQPMCQHLQDWASNPYRGDTESNRDKLAAIDDRKHSLEAILLFVTENLNSNRSFVGEEKHI